MHSQGLYIRQREGEVIFSGPQYGLCELTTKGDGEGNTTAIAADPGPSVGAEAMEMWGMVPSGSNIASPGIFNLGFYVLWEDALQSFGDMGPDAFVAVERHREGAASNQPVPCVVSKKMKVAMGVGDGLAIRHYGPEDIVAERCCCQLPRCYRHNAVRKSGSEAGDKFPRIGIGGDY